MTGRLVPLEWVWWRPGDDARVLVGRDTRSGSLAPGRGPQAWAPPRVVEYLWTADGVARGVVVEIAGADKLVKVDDDQWLAGPRRHEGDHDGPV